jgi:predicted transcriptional regulator
MRLDQIGIVFDGLRMDENMTLTISLPDELASWLMAILPEEARQRFAVTAIEDALLAQERDSEECIAAVEEALAEIKTGQTISLKAEQARWQSQQAALLNQ